MPKGEADELIAEIAGDKRALEQTLGLPKGFLETNVRVRVDIPQPRDFDLRIPSGTNRGTAI